MRVELRIYKDGRTYGGNAEDVTEDSLEETLTEMANAAARYFELGLDQEEPCPR